MTTALAAPLAVADGVPPAGTPWVCTDINPDNPTHPVDVRVCEIDDGEP